MVKGVSRQVIVVQAPDPKLFEQAIFILKDNAEAVSDETLLKEAENIVHSSRDHKRAFYRYGLVWAFGGAAITGLLWLLISIL